jgi:hypothetical protein
MFGYMKKKKDILGIGVGARKCLEADRRKNLLGYR